MFWYPHFEPQLYKSYFLVPHSGWFWLTSVRSESMALLRGGLMMLTELALTLWLIIVIEQEKKRAQTVRPAGDTGHHHRINIAAHFWSHRSDETIRVKELKWHSASSALTSLMSYLWMQLMFPDPQFVCDHETDESIFNLELRLAAQMRSTVSFTVPRFSPLRALVHLLFNRGCEPRGANSSYD